MIRTALSGFGVVVLLVPSHSPAPLAVVLASAGADAWCRETLCAMVYTVCRRAVSTDA